MAVVERIQAATPATVRPVARLGPRSLPFIPAQSVRRGMVMFTEDGGYDVVESVAEIPLDRPVYDLNVEHTHNFIADGLVTHNTSTDSEARTSRTSSIFATTS